MTIYNNNKVYLEYLLFTYTSNSTIIIIIIIILEYSIRNYPVYYINIDYADLVLSI